MPCRVPLVHRGITPVSMYQGAAREQGGGSCDRRVTVADDEDTSGQRAWGLRRRACAEKYCPGATRLQVGGRAALTRPHAVERRWSCGEEDDRCRRLALDVVDQDFRCKLFTVAASATGWASGTSGGSIPTHCPRRGCSHPWPVNRARRRISPGRPRGRRSPLTRRRYLQRQRKKRTWTTRMAQVRKRHDLILFLPFLWSSP